jgi:hypothetical protein
MKLVPGDYIYVTGYNCVPVKDIVAVTDKHGKVIDSLYLPIRFYQYNSLKPIYNLITDIFREEDLVENNDIITYRHGILR